MAKAVEEIVGAIAQLQDDTTLSRSIKGRLQEVSEILSNNEEDSIKINKALDKLDQLSDDSNLEPFARTQVWNIASMLESV